ncbi:MAG: hypothetical protein PVJ68_06220 [Candidatus Thiodiazotropha sp.]|jgi:hypothetical protein
MTVRLLVIHFKIQLTPRITWEALINTQISLPRSSYIAFAFSSVMMAAKVLPLFSAMITSRSAVAMHIA